MSGSSTNKVTVETEQIDNAGFVDGTTNVFPTGYVFDEAAGTALTENDVAAARIDSKRAQVLVIEDGTTRGDRAKVESAGTWSATIGQTTKGLTANARNHQIFSSEHPDNVLAAAGDDLYYGQNMDQHGNLCSNISSIRGTLVRVINTAGTQPPPLPIGGIGVSSTPSAVTSTRAVNAYFDVNGRLCIFSDQSLITAGSVADDATTPSNPVMVGGQAVSPDGTDPTAVAENDVVRFRTDLNRRQYVATEHPRWWSYHEDSSSALTDATVQSAPGSGLSVVITEICVSTGAATALNFFLEEGSTKIFGPIYLEAVAGRGFVWKGNKHVTANTAVTITTSAAILHSIDIQGHIAAV